MSNFYFHKNQHKTALKFSIPALILISLISMSTFGNTAFAENDDEVVIIHTDSGQLVIEFFPEDAPNTVKNFLDLTESGFYDNLVFHRIIKDFMIQGGDPLTKFEGGFYNLPMWGTGSAGYEIPAEFNNIKHDRGIVSMARGADVNSASSQFFIVHKDSNHLDFQYTVFGKLMTEESYDTLDKLANLSTTGTGTPNDLHAAKIIKAEVVTRADISKAHIPAIKELERSEDSGIMDFDRYVNTEYNFSVIPPKGWTLLYPLPDSGPNDPIITFLSPKKKLKEGIAETQPYVYINAIKLGDQTFQENLDSRTSQYHKMEATGALIIESEKILELTTTKGETYAGYFLTAKQAAGGLPTPFAQVIISHSGFLFGITYTNHEQYFQDDMILFDNMLASYEQISDVSESGVSEIDIGEFLKEAGIKEEEPETTGLEYEPLIQNDEEASSGGGGCLIATATFGSEMAPQVQFLREIRDNTVLQTESGTSFMTTFNQFYYSFSPVIADYERENPAFKETVKLALTPLLTSLTLLQYADIDSESEMLGYGIGIILLNIGMYFVAPAVLIMKIRSLHKLQ